MANYFVNSVDGVGGTADGSTWANAYLTLAAALTARLAGDTFWIGSNHAETQASAMTNTSPGTPANPCFILCVDHTKSSPGTGDLKTTATISTTGNSGITNAGSFYCYGVTFNLGSGAVAPSLNIGNTINSIVEYDSCNLVIAATGGAIISNSALAATVLLNTTMQFGATTQNVKLSGNIIWKRTPSAIGGATFPATLLSVTAVTGQLSLEGVDLSALGSGKTIFGALASSSQNFFMKDCKTNSAVTIAATPLQPGGRIYLSRTDSSGTNNQFGLIDYSGTESIESTITRVGGSATPDGSLFSKKLVTTANSRWTFPFMSLPLGKWNALVGSSRTVTIYGTINAGSVPNNDDIWAEIIYPGSAASPLGSFANSTKANLLATGSAYSTDASSWNGGGSGAGWSPFVITVPLTAQLASSLTISMQAAKASTTWYIDPTAYFS